jgi:hypothetical protein
MSAFDYLMPQQVADAAALSSASDFYRNFWKGKKDFETLPVLSRKALLGAPLVTRRYKKEKGILKLVRGEWGAALVEWCFADIEAEHFGLVGKRPMIYFKSPYEAIEKSLWCYARGAVPLIAEPNEAVAQFTAEAYEIDSLIADLYGADKLKPYLLDREPLETLSILVASEQEAQQAVSFARLAKKATTILALPETGALAHAPTGDPSVFAPAPGAWLEYEEGRIVATKLSLLATPIVRYDTGVSATITP